ncbi:MAG: hypothetical protein SFW09_13035 [Hyphomicrobiaceae bacterium]|nr:hypothetical protein [Hyphomicrobiaceae bacterium]
MAGHLNGSGPSPGSGKVASLDDARRRAAARVKEEQRAQRTAARGGPMSTRDWIIGIAFLAMSLGMLWHWLAPLVGATGVTR